MATQTQTSSQCHICIIYVQVSEAQTSSGGVRLSSSIQQARDYAVAQAQQDGVLGNFKIFDSPFGNFLVPVIPTAKELADNQFPIQMRESDFITYMQKNT